MLEMICFLHAVSGSVDVNESSAVHQNESFVAPADFDKFCYCHCYCHQQLKMKLLLLFSDKNLLR